MDKSVRVPGLGVGFLFKWDDCLTDWPLLLDAGDPGRLEQEPVPEEDGLLYPAGPRLYKEPVLWPGK